MKLSCLFGHKWNGCTCTRCGERRDEEHKWDGCTCKICGKVRSTGHFYTNFKNKYNKCCGTCKCGATQTLDHNFQRVAGKCSLVCTRCGKEQFAGHTWKRIPGTCRNQCTVCGATDTIRPDEHDWQRVDGRCVEKCAVCGCERDIDYSAHDWQRAEGRCVEKCAVCGRERDIGHTWAYVPGTCTEKCTVCGATREKHSYVNGRCSRCGSQGPEAFMAECVEKLLAIFPTTPLDYAGHASFDAAHRAEVRRIGEQLNELDGMRAMRRVGEEFARRRPIHARKLETTWDGIGNWMG